MAEEQDGEAPDALHMATYLLVQRLMGRLVVRAERGGTFDRKDAIEIMAAVLQVIEESAPEATATIALLRQDHLRREVSGAVPN